MDDINTKIKYAIESVIQAEIASRSISKATDDLKYVSQDVKITRKKLQVLLDNLVKGKLP